MGHSRFIAVSVLKAPELLNDPSQSPCHLSMLLLFTVTLENCRYHFFFFKGQGNRGQAGQGGAVGDKGKHCKAPPLSWKHSAREPAFPHFVQGQPSPHASSHMNSYHALKNGNSIFKNSKKQSLLRTVFCEDRWPYDTHTPQ